MTTGGMLSLPLVELAHEVSEFVVIASGLRMLKAWCVNKKTASITSG
jgi:cation transport ATPase